MAGYSGLTIGILALQGDFERHEEQIRRLGATPRLVKLPSDLAGLDALIIPGGESTTMNILLDRFKLREPLTEFARRKPVYGTCAGMIMLATGIEDNQSGVKPLGVLDIDVVRNGYGRQIFSSEESLPATFEGHNGDLKATFIRAPRITRLGKGVECLARRGQDVVLVRQGRTLASSFHCELGPDLSVLKYFLDKCLAEGHIEGRQRR